MAAQNAFVEDHRKWRNPPIINSNDPGSVLTGRVSRGDGGGGVWGTLGGILVDTALAVAPVAGQLLQEYVSARFQVQPSNDGFQRRWACGTPSERPL